MEIKFRRRNKNQSDNKVNRPSILIILFLSAIFVLSSINLLKDLSSQNGIRPFGFVEEIIAQVTNPSSPQINLSSIESTDVKDNADRCVAINPATGKPYRNSVGKSSSVTGKAGINQGDVGDGIDGRISFIQGENSIGQDLGMGYILSMFTNPGEFESAASYVKKTVDAGMIPIVRLCYPGNCGFRMDDNSIIEFYRNLNSRLEDGYEFVGLIGPNEPTTSAEMVSFGLADRDYAKMFEHVNRISNELQNIRVNNGGKMYIAPIAFNLINTLGDISIDDFRQFRNYPINTDNLDYLMGNVYDSINLGYNSYDIIVNSGLKEFAEDKNLKIILSEYGVFDLNPASLNLAENNFTQFCSDATIDGISFFRSFDELSAPDPKPTQLTTEFIAKLTQSCSRQRPWLNCNFDSAIYPNHPEKVNLVPESLSSAAPTCVVREENNSKGAGLLVSCSGNDCSAKMVSTIQARLPVKHFGSNSSFGTKTKSFTPISSEIAQYVPDSDYDPLNEFAGELFASNGFKYPMPKLGSAINNTTQLSIYLPDFARYPNLQSYPSPGSFSSNAKKSIAGEIEKEIGGALSYYPSGVKEVQDGTIYVPDEMVVAVNGNNVDKTDQGYIKGLRLYDPFKINSTYKKLPNSCSGTMKYLENQDDYINGPEVVVEEKTYWNGSSGELCRLYGERNRAGQSGVELETSSNLNCSINPTRTIPVTNASGVVVNALCRNLFSCDFNGGFCTIDPYYSQCIDYTPAPEDKVYIYTRDYPSIPSFQVKYVWDALYRQYQILQDNLKSRGLKMVFQENIGWKAEYQSHIRDANRKVNDPEPYYYSSSPDELTFDQNGISGSAYQPKLFDNASLFAKGKSTVSSQQYYDWLGYLDIIQEMRMVALFNTELEGEKLINNPYYNQQNKPNNSRSQILLSGRAYQLTSFPVMSCDQVEMCKQKDQLVADLGQETADKLCPVNQLNSNAAFSCITTDDDQRFDNKLQTALCGRGYSIEGVCVGTGMRCIPKGATTPGQPNDNNFNFNSPEEKLLFPVSKSREIPNCVEPQSVISVPVPVDWNLKYFEENTNPINISNFKLTPEASASFISMMSDMRSQSPQSFAQCAINWGYRSKAMQEAEVRKEGSCGRATACACHSEHQLGTTLDFVANATNFVGVGSFRNTDCYTWLTQNAHQYGFVNSYGTADPNNYMAEPWHWRWISTEYAQEFYEQQSSFSRNVLNYLETKPHISEGGVGVPTTVTCPVAGGKCVQGVGGSFSHSRLNAVDVIGDNRQVIAPMDGVVTRFVENYCIDKTYDAGDGFILKGMLGGVEREVFFYHVDVRGSGIQIGQRFSAGEPMVQMADVGDITLSGNPLNSLNCKSFQQAGVNIHVHVEIVGAGASANPETNANNVLNAMGCNMHTGVASCLPNSTLDYGGQELMCIVDGGYVIANKIYDSFDDLVKAVAEYVGGAFNTFYPAELLRATVQIETSATTENGRPYGGDPSLIAHQNENAAGASGPTQFLAGVFMGIVQSNQIQLQGCLEHVGLNVPTLSPDSRNILGVALCATAIKHNTNMLYFLPTGTFGNTIKSSDDWFNRVFSPNTGRANWGDIFEQRGLSRADGERYDFRTQNISAVEVTGRRYYGACYPSLAVQDSGGYNYCTSLYDFAKSYNY